MKRLFLTSQVSFVADKIGAKIDPDLKKNAVFINTAIKDKSHSHLEWHFNNKAAMEANGFDFNEYDLTGKNENDIKKDLAKYSIVYVEGGNSFYLLQESQKSGFDKYIKQRVEEGMIYVGTSAGSVITGPDINPIYQQSRAALAPELQGTTGFNLTNFVVIPHWGQEKRRELFDSFRLNHIYKDNYPYIFLSDYQYVEVAEDTFKIIDIKNN